MNIGIKTPQTEFMESMLRPANIDATHGKAWLPTDEKPASAPSQRVQGAVAIGKINLILIGLIVVILFVLISKEDAGSGLPNQAARIQTQIVTAAAPEVTTETPVSAVPPEVTPMAEQPVAAPPTLPKASSKKPKKVEVTAPVTDSGPVVQVHTSQVQTAQAQPVIEPTPPKDASTKMLVFNIWSVSELRLRSAYTTLMNDSAIPAAQLEARKKDYLSFVTQRTRKCGDLDNKFAGNINTVEKLSFNKGDVDMLECHAAENNTELDKLNTAMTHNS